MIRHLVRLLLTLTAGLCPAVQAADQPDHPSYKFTTGLYPLSDRTTGIDLNLRQTSRLGNVWIGVFHLPDGSGNQWRAGWDRTFGDVVRISPSVQLASGGFAGGSLQVETGAAWFIGAGIGRTNLRPYYNLNFDPNDALMFSAGWRSEGNRSLAFQYVKDNRENPDQRHMHLVWRQALPDDEHLGIDLLYKTGLVNQHSIHRVGLSLGYEWRSVFVKLAWDPNTNFTPENSVRLQGGLRF